MIFIPPMEIATRIMTLIDNAKTELILVSPYISIDNWAKFKKCLQRAIDRGVNITIYARENATQNLETIKSFNVNLFLVKDLHAKIYLNDTYAIASSQNLIQYSDDNSIDFGYSTETEKERQQLLGLINQYLIVSKPIKPTSRENVKADALEREEILKEEIAVFKNFEIRKLYKTFSDKYDGVRINGEETYVYCSKLFSFADVMFREGLEIRFNFQHKENEVLVKILEDLDLKYNHYQYKREFKIYNERNYTFIFVPQNVTDFQKLIYDYVFMCNRILEKTINSIKPLPKTELHINKDHIANLYQHFKNEFPDSNFKVNSKYLFSNNLISFADVLIDEVYKLKIEMDRIDFKAIKEILEKLDLSYNYRYTKNVYQEYDSRIYFSIIPEKWDNFQLLISDYIAITKEIWKKTENVILNN
jgi:hypothetical protein